MDIEQIKKERGHLETAIAFMLYEFSQQTKMEVASIEVSPIWELGKEMPVTYTVKVEVKI